MKNKKQKIKKNKNTKLFIIFRDSINCLIKGSKCKYKISYILLPFLPILFLIIGYFTFIYQVIKIIISGFPEKLN